MSFRNRAPVSTTLFLILFGGLLTVAAAPTLLPMLVLIPTELTRPWAWYRFLTYALVQASLRNWLLVGGIILLSGWIAERWLERRAMWIIAGVAAVASGVIYAVLAPLGRPLIGGGFIAAGFAGAAVVSCALRRHDVSRGTQLIALALGLMYGLTPLRPDPQSLAMFGAFIIAGGYAASQLKSPGRTPADQQTVSQHS